MKERERERDEHVQNSVSSFSILHRRHDRKNTKSWAVQFPSLLLLQNRFSNISHRYPSRHDAFCSACEFVAVSVFLDKIHLNVYVMFGLLLFSIIPDLFTGIFSPNGLKRSFQWQWLKEPGLAVPLRVRGGNRGSVTQLLEERLFREPGFLFGRLWISSLLPAVTCSGFLFHHGPINGTADTASLQFHIRKWKPQDTISVKVNTTSQEAVCRAQHSGWSSGRWVLLARSGHRK